MKFYNLVLLILTVCVSISCQSVNLTDVPREGTVTLPDKIILDVVLISQNDTYSCATTSAAMAISYFENRNNNPLDKDEVWEISKTSKSAVHCCGNDMDGLKRIADHYGYESEYTEDLSVCELEYLLSRGILTVINLKQKVDSNATHAFLLVGYDRVNKYFYVNDPGDTTGGAEISYSRLQSLWSAYLSSPSGMSNKSGFIIYPRSQVINK